MEIYICLDSFPKKQSLNSCKLKEFVDDSIKFDEMEKCSSNGRDTQWEITSYQQFFLFPRCFQKTCIADM